MQDWMMYAMGGMIVSSLMWAAAYFIFPAALNRFLATKPPGALMPHLIRTRNFVVFCAVHHLIMCGVATAYLVGGIDSMMKAMAVAIPIEFTGGVYSLFSASALSKFADDFIKKAKLE